MSEVQKAIEELTCFSRTFPEKAFQIITAHKEEAVPYLREAVGYALSKRGDLDPDYQLHFYALYLLGEFRDRESFPKIMEIASLHSDEVEYLIGDCITANLRDILYSTYDGNIELLKRTIQNRDVDEYVRSAMLDVMGQLYLDGILAENEWKEFLRQIVFDGREYDYLYDAAGYMLCRCHFIDMLPEIRYMFDEDLIDSSMMGEYDSYIDGMFEYRENEENFCAPLNAAEALRHWAMFSDESEGKAAGKKDFAKLLRAMERELDPRLQKKKTGRNDLCPCGSGKKYKLCCLNRPKDVMDSIESLEGRSKCLRDYPYTGQERIDGRIYLADFFDAESIEIDQILYLALRNRPGFIWNRNIEAEKKRTKEYLYLAFQKCVAKMEAEQIPSFGEYDARYSIHYRCEKWIGELCGLLEKNKEPERYKEIKKAVSEKGDGIDAFNGKPEVELLP